MPAALRLILSGSKTRAVRDEDTPIVLKAIEQYREFKKTHRIFRSEVRRREKLLNAFERRTSVESRSKIGCYGSK
jgi:hypothetical protein